MQSSSLDSASPAIGPAQELNTGQRRWLAEVYEANYLGVVRLCTRLLRNPEDAADAAQDVFVIAANSLDPSAPPGQARAWLLTVARNHCLDALRRRTRLGKALVTLGSQPDPSRDLEGAVADRQFLDSVFKQLSLRERQALWQSAVESRPLADIASGLRLSYMAAAQVLHRARQRAVKAASRVAVVFGIFQLGRQRAGAGALTAAQRVAAVVAVPLIVVSMNASSPTPQAASASAAPAATSRSSGVVPRNPLPALLQRGTDTSALPDSVRSGATSALNSATDAVRGLLKPLPSVPPVLAPTPALPSLPPLPSPPPIP